MFNNRKHNTGEVKYLHEDLDDSSNDYTVFQLSSATAETLNNC